MIATVTLNPSIDKSLIVRDLELGKTNRGEVVRMEAGGKGINVAKALKLWGSTVFALGLVARNDGQFILDAISTQGIPADFVRVPGDTRVCLKIHDTRSGAETELNELGVPVTPADLGALRRKIEHYAPQCNVMVFSGSLPPGAPPGTFSDLIRVANECGAKCILDTSGVALKFGLGAGPYLVKPNRAEAADLLGRPLRTRLELLEAAREFMRMGAEHVVISLGAVGALGVAGAETLFALPPDIELRSSTGAGDAMVAAMAIAVVERLSFREAFRLAVAAGAATAALDGTKMAERSAVKDLIPKVTLKEAME
jgi:1-phosphofructokinase